MNFGEVLVPSSRAFWDDFDDEIEAAAFNSEFLAKVNWIWLTEDGLTPKELKVNFLVVIEGSGMKEFMKSAVLKNLKPIGKSQNDKVFVYHISESSQLLCFSDENDLNFSAPITEYLNAWVEEADEVFTFSLLSNVQYKGDDLDSVKNDITFMRGINSKFDFAKELKAPNFITGLCAGVASLRYIKNLSIASYIGYTDPANELDGLAAQPILNLFSKMGIQCDAKYAHKYKDPPHLYM